MMPLDTGPSQLGKQPGKQKTGQHGMASRGQLSRLVASAVEAHPLRGNKGSSRADSAVEPTGSQNTTVTPRSFRSSPVSPGRTSASISFSRNAGSYCSSPKLRSQAEICIASGSIRQPLHSGVR
jgi:hypothetical protein